VALTGIIHDGLDEVHSSSSLPFGVKLTKDDFQDEVVVDSKVDEDMQEAAQSWNYEQRQRRELWERLENAAKVHESKALQLEVACREPAPEYFENIQDGVLAHPTSEELRPESPGL
jgi:hypothetical protein